jgi:ATP-binding cassette, subfamily B, bacterial
LKIGWGEIIRCGGSISRVIEILATKPAIEQTTDTSKIDVVGRPESTDYAHVHAEINFDSVSFAYPTRMDSPALRNISFSVPYGTSVALVGRSGGGKSTIVQLLQRFYDPSSGSIQIEGRPLNGFDLRYLRGHIIGVVPQDPVVFSGTIAENISFGKPGGASQSEIYIAARDAGVLDFASRLPAGLDTYVSPSVGGLSGGEKQRVMIARCLVKNPKILLLDEATSALDATSEAMVNDTIERLMSDRRRTVVVVTHRLAIAQRCDRIVVLDEGVILEDGSHAELSKNRSSSYCQLLKVQTAEADHFPSRI